jgi:spermidine synthase
LTDSARSRAALLLFFASGAVGLIYQVVWVRLFIHVFGATVLAVSTVLAAFMGGLALGGLWAGRRAARMRNPLRTYGLLEAGLAVYAALVPFLLKAMHPLYEAVYPGLSGSFAALSAFRFVVSLLILLPPTFLMGATLPVLTAHAERMPTRIRARVAHLYATNTFGAVAGTALASFILLATLGMRGTLVFGVGLNVTVALVALLLARGGNDRPILDDDDADMIGPQEDLRPIPRPLLLGTAGVLGFSALAFEILWTRTLALALGTTTYAFAIVLTVFLLGIAGGSAIAGRLLRGGIVRARRLFVAAPAAIGLLALGTLPLFDRLPDLFVALSTRGGGSWGEGLLVRFLLAGLPLLPPTLISGAAFPLAIGIDRRSGGAGRSVGDVYASNTFGAILGSWAAGFLLIPTVGLRGGLIIGATLQIAATCALLLARRGRRAPVAAIALAAGTVALVTLLPDWNRSALTRGGFAVAIDLRRYGQTELGAEKRDLVFLDEGITSTITVRRWGDELTMQMNGVTEASNTGDMATQVFVGGLGTILHADPKDVLVIGLGSGITASAAARHPGMESIECVEISESVVEAARLFRESNGNILEDPRFTMIVGDGRNHLQLSGRTYDVIVSQPSNVWNAGIGALMSSEFFAMAREKLRPGGILVSWIQGYSLTPDALRSVLAAAGENFEETTLWMAGWGDLVIVAGDERFSVDAGRLLEKGRDEEIGQMFRQMEAPDVLTLLSRNLIAGDAMDRYVGDFPANNDDNLYLEFEAPKLLYRETIPELFESLNAGMGGTEQIVTNAPPGLVDAIDRVRRAAVLENRARVAFRAEHGDEGMLLLDEALRLHPESRTIRDIYAQALDGRGETKLRAGEAQAAAQDFVRATQIDPSAAKPFDHLAQVYLDAGQLTTAASAVEEALRRAPRHPDYLARRAELQVRMREFDAAETTAREVLSLDSRHRGGLIALGEALRGQGRGAVADSVLDAAALLYPDDEKLRRLRRKSAAS